jgi:hypothetical protein
LNPYIINSIKGEIMSASSVTGVGGGSAGRNNNNKDTRLKGPRIVASGYFQTSSDDEPKFNVIFPRELKNGIDNYVVLVTVENPLPDDEGLDSNFQGVNYHHRVTKLDSRWSQSEDDWQYDDDVTPGGMTGFVIHLSAPAGGGEGTRDTQIMWMVMTVGYDISEFVDE